MQELIHRKATIDDLKAIITLLLEDEFGKTRESLTDETYLRYMEAFKRIDSDHNQHLTVIESKHEIIGTCHLTIMPSLLL
jgi:N-acetylglutamate synthase-like GNAT family acetyltransferase